MIADTRTDIAAIRFNKVGKLYHFDASEYPRLRPADFVIVETSRGRQLGQIIGFVSPGESRGSHVKPISRPATARDLMLKQLWEAKEIGALVDIRELGVNLTREKGIKFVKARYNYDGSQLAVLYVSEETNVNTTSLRKKLESHFSTRVTLRRIGSRDAAKLIGEYGACGAPRCCSTHLTEFSPISIKMAKAQGISLNPSEITGMCGRLRCCLIYEYEQYVEAMKKLPRRKKMVGTPYGRGKVIGVDPLKQTVTVIVENTRYEVHAEDLIPLEELEALQQKAAQGCSREGEGGVCECGSRVRPGAAANAEKKSQQKTSRRRSSHKRQPRSKKSSSKDSRNQASGRQSSKSKRSSRGHRPRRPKTSGGQGQKDG